MGWVAATPAQFTPWHDGRCTTLGIPFPGRRQSDNAVVVDNEWTCALVQPTFVATVQNKTVWVVNLPAGEVIPGALILDSLTADPDSLAITVVFNGKSATATPTAPSTAKTKPQSIVIDGVTYTRTR